MSQPTVAIIDIIGLTYDPTTVEKFGLGGSESAVIYMAKELSNLGFKVTVFNNCIDSRAKPGVYDGVTYRDLSVLQKGNTFAFDVMISSRTIIPFVPEKDWKDFGYPCEVFQHMSSAARLKIVWLHDTFCSGDHLIEGYLLDGHIDKSSPSQTSTPPISPPPTTES